MLYFVAENPLYTGKWWSDGGYRLWGAFAPDEVDRCFYIPQEVFWHLLVLAQKLPDWYSDDEMPITWQEVNQND